MNTYIKFLFSLIKIGCIGFGGGSALIPIIEKEIIEKQELDTKENLDRDVIVASITPGALPVEIAASMGKRNFGIKGMVSGSVAMALPGTILTILMLTLLSVVQSQVLSAIELLSVGVSVFIIYLLIHYIVEMIKDCEKESRQRKYKALVLMSAVFFLVCEKNIYRLFNIDRTPVFSLSTVHVLIVAFFCIFYSRGIYNIRHIAVMLILSCSFLLSHGKLQIITDKTIMFLTELSMFFLAIWGIYQNIKKDNWQFIRQGKDIYKDILFWLIFLIVGIIPALCIHSDAIIYTGKGIMSAIMSFGGGDAYLTIADGLFVEDGKILAAQYYGQIVPVVNVLPGSILCKTLAGVGYYVGFNLTGSPIAGLFFALAGFVCSVGASCLFFAIAYHLYDNLVLLWQFRMVSRWIRPIIAGFLINIIIALCNQSMEVMTGYSITKPVTGIGMLLLLLLDVFCIQKKKVGLFRILLINVGIVLLVTQMKTLAFI